MKRLSGYPRWFYRLLISALSIITFSGLLMLPTALEFKLGWDVEWRLMGREYTLIAALHLLSGILVMMILGALWQQHIKAGLRKKHNHVSGIIGASSLCILSLTGVGLYYIGSISGQLYSSIIHSSVGLLLFVLVIWHILHGRRIRSSFQKSRQA